MKQEIFRYLVAGAVAFVADLLTLTACTELLGLHYLVSNLFGYFVGLTIAYVLNTRWVFRYRRYADRSWIELLIFNAIVVAGLGVSEGSMALLVEGLGLHYLYAKVFSSALVMVFNFTAKKLILFNPAHAVQRPAID